VCADLASTEEEVTLAIVLDMSDRSCVTMKQQRPHFFFFSLCARVCGSCGALLDHNSEL